MEAGGECVVALLQHSLQQGEGLGQVALGVVVQLGQAVVHALRQDLLQQAARLAHTLRQLAGLLHHSLGAGWRPENHTQREMRFYPRSREPTHKLIFSHNSIIKLLLKFGILRI